MATQSNNAFEQILYPGQDTSKPQVCQLIDCVNENIGGPALSVTNLAHALSKHAIGSHLFTLDYSKHGRQVSAAGVTLHSERANYLAIHFRGYQPSANRALKKLAQENFDIIHNHGLWMFPNIYARQAASENELPLVISPRGMLEAWSLNYGRSKKWLAWHLYEKKNLAGAALFHATSLRELESIRALGLNQPIAMIPNGVPLPDLAKTPDRDILIQKFPELKGKKWLLCLCRIHPKKGLDSLLQAWHQLATSFQDWHLIIAGPDIIGYQSQLTSLTTELNLHNCVTFTGMLSNEPKSSALGNADLFVLPTHSENFGIAVAESLAHGVPVITTKEAPWQELITHHCGWWIDDTSEALETALIEGLEMSSEKRRDMGLSGRKLVEDRYSWNFIAQQMSEVYYWLLGKGIAPDCIYLQD